MVDDWNFHDVVRFKWFADYAPNAKTWYAARKVTLPNGKQIKERMHRRIKNPGTGFDVDHFDHNGLNNTDKNLRKCTRRQNGANRRDQSSHGVGVGFDKRGKPKPYYSHARINKKRVRLGSFVTAEEAQEARKRFLAEHEKEKHVT